ncbi:hypothetical protein EZS27_043225, partial [termite gut metagenome]
ETEMHEIYGVNLSTSAISIIANKVTQASIEWQNRPLERLYLIGWMDGIVFKVPENGKVINKTVYLCVGLTKEGMKEVLGMRVGKSESASFWMGVLTELKARGVEHILITVPDNLNGFTDTINSVFPRNMNNGFTVLTLNFLAILPIARISCIIAFYRVFLITQMMIHLGF